MTVRYVPCLLLALLASACAVQGVRPGATESEILQTMGAPALELRDPDGSRHLAYPTGPFGLQTHMARIGPDGRLRALEQVLDDGRFHTIQPGMTREELLRLIGPPAETMRFDNLRQTSWDYRFRDTWGYLAILSVMIDDQGLVASRITRRIERERRSF
jgi:outer membrane protein assembly factor BamE (lipoprotein component of BamABCDE complex)